MHTTRVCAFPDCGVVLSPTAARGLCPGHYSQHRLGRPLTPILRGVHARFWAKVEKTDACWNWIGTRSAKGYGHFKALPNTKTPTKAHRWSYEDAYGPIPDGLTIDHLCRNTSCVRPDHLEAVEGAVNTLRGYNPCAINARKVRCKWGHDLSEGNFYRHANGGRVCKQCKAEEQRKRRAKKAMANLG